MEAKLITTRVQFADKSKDKLDLWNVEKVTLGWKVLERSWAHITFCSSEGRIDDVCAYISDAHGSRLEDDDLTPVRSKIAEFLLFLSCSIYRSH